ncbi:hypothetical protein COX05_04210 [candidate division WWE3 bacterium CG22_combo_CG10-13_8_21_14_all_39_12]|uniref:VanZ-like domain-containing protein n=2 Tax=Katanobacteria TaxID=422282 RepID=A0A2M7X362_UNCKA|nr:MAG: hypothetical protein COX05_04210 [candidate division WWE3 bacterium CG22_combo_CG10-13_8_21_14_all_39_12]PJA40580.1 MAG: hypothetical protein CO179_01815 [candidate division WWE3 bacterium CG_4_9_14_3_um_filter_39_7]
MKIENYKKSIIRFVPAVIWMSIIFYVSSIPNLELNGELSAYDLVLRKIAHMVEYAILVVLFWWGLEKPLTKRAQLEIFLMAFIYALSDEFHQNYVPTRDGKLTDVLIDTVGIITAIGLIRYIASPKQK